MIPPQGTAPSSASALSAEPPLLSFRISTAASFWPHLRDADTAVVHLLGAGHTDPARTISTSDIDRVGAPTRWRRLSTGAPLIYHDGSFHVL